ncbi:biopolymer transport protein ExbD [Sinobacterium caligoides]|uniref:Biopolymer transport protein ExbD n=1 Tax=Sinobacterium caligoides TaxID=933926 RepID=A0A3N2DGB7_9GAMM|nr:biopolymer transporter ExbD [Sinobacterium caligoides]ROR98840.1 biopolymer transport protein ExbD [Sinobacterium caligoides]
MPKSVSARKPEPEQQIDLTPMLDVVFIMLIFFIVTASFIKEPGVDVERPVAETRDLVKNQNILIAITQGDKIWIDKKEIDKRFVKAIIERMHAENPKGAVVVQADKSSTAEMFALVVDAAKQAGVVDIVLAAEGN